MKKLFNSKSFAFMHSLRFIFIKFRDLTSPLGVTHYEVFVSLISLWRERSLAGTGHSCSAEGSEQFRGADVLLWHADTGLYCPGLWAPQSSLHYYLPFLGLWPSQPLLCLHPYFVSDTALTTLLSSISPLRFFSIEHNF